MPTGKDLCLLCRQIMGFSFQERRMTRLSAEEAGGRESHVFLPQASSVEPFGFTTGAEDEDNPD